MQVDTQYPSSAYAGKISNLSATVVGEPRHDLQSTSFKAEKQPSSQGLVIKLRPRGQLRSVVYTHQVADHDCWTFISDGFAALGQKEIVITVLKEQDAPRPESPPQYFEILFSQVQTGKLVNDFDMAIFSDFQFLGGSHFIAFVHTTPTPLGNFPLPENYLQAIALTKPEVDVVMRYGALRFLSHLGGSVRYFPYPPWIDSHRKTVITMNDFSESLLNSLPFNDVMGVQAVKVGEDVHAYMSSKAAEVLAQQLGLDSVAVLPCNPLEDADSCLLWRNGQSLPSAIGTRLNRTNLCFLCFCPLPESEFLLEFREDGYICKYSS